MPMNDSHQFSRAERALAERSRRQAETEAARAKPGRLATAINEFIGWRAFAYWIRLLAEKRGIGAVGAFLQDRCLGFLEARNLSMTLRHLPA